MPIGTSAASCARAATPERPTGDEAARPAITWRRSGRRCRSVMAGLHCGGMSGVKTEFAKRRDRGAIVDAQRVVEAVEKAGQRDAQRQFDDLGFAEVKP